MGDDLGPGFGRGAGTGSGRGGGSGCGGWWRNWDARGLVVVVVVSYCRCSAADYAGSVNGVARGELCGA